MLGDGCAKQATLQIPMNSRLANLQNSLWEVEYITDSSQSHGC